MMKIQPENIKEIAESFAKSFNEHFGITLDFSPNSLKLLDQTIDHYFDPKTILPTTILDIGFYIGEVIRRNLGGTWEMENNNPVTAKIIFESGRMEVYPIGKAKKRVDNGKEDSLSFYYERVEAYSREQT